MKYRDLPIIKEEFENEKFWLIDGIEVHCRSSQESRWYSLVEIILKSYETCDIPAEIVKS